MYESSSVFPSELTISDLTTIMVIGEGKQRNEVGFSILDLDNQPIVYLNQIVDNFWFTDVFKKIVAFQINVIVIPDYITNKLSLPKLLHLLSDKFPNVPQVKQNFRSYDTRKGIEHVKRLCVAEYTTGVLSVADEKPFALASFAALLDYIITNMEASFAPKTMKIEFLVNFGKLSIDVDTVFRLELINPATSTMSNQKVAVSLFKILNTCVTKMGRDSLRAMILEPMSDLAQITDRQNCIGELINRQSLLHNIKVELNKFQEVHKLMKLPYVMSSVNSVKASESMINLIVLLKNTLQDLPALRVALEDCSCPFIQYLCLGLKNPKFEQILTKIDTVLQTDAQAAHRSRSGFGRMFAVKTGVNEFLDVMRRYFSKYVDEMREHVAAVATQVNLPLRMNHTLQKGFHIQLFLTKELRNPLIPDGLEVISKTPKCITMIDAKFYDLNAKVLKVAQEVDIMSNGIISELYATIRSEIHVIYLFIDIITEIDVLLALAHFSKTIGTVRPVFGDEIEVVDAVHPLLDACWKSRDIVPNSINCSPEYNFFVITGNNMAGKTIYIKMIATLQILAQLGCWVPARTATFRMCDKIMSRIGFDDNIEQNASSFTIEMQEIEFILFNVTPFSLIIVDELFRSTNIEEAQVLSWCFCEILLKYVAFLPSKEEISSGSISDSSEIGDMKLSSVRVPYVFVTTHFEHLLKLTFKFMNVTNLILTDDFKATVYKPEEHQNQKQLKLVKAIKFPQSVIEHAEKLLSIPGLITNGPNFAEFFDTTSLTLNQDRSTISSILSGFTGNPKDLYDIYSMVAQEARNENPEGQEKRHAALKVQLTEQIERMLNNISDSSNFFINDDNSSNKTD